MSCVIWFVVISTTSVVTQAYELNSKILVFNDIHFDPNITSSLSCIYMNCSDLGILDHTDSPLKLIETIFDKAKSEIESSGETLNAIIISGDFIKHNFAIGKDGVSI